MNLSKLTQTINFLTELNDDITDLKTLKVMAIETYKYSMPLIIKNILNKYNISNDIVGWNDGFFKSSLYGEEDHVRTINAAAGEILTHLKPNIVTEPVRLLLTDGLSDIIENGDKENSSTSSDDESIVLSEFRELLLLKLSALSTRLMYNVTKPTPKEMLTANRITDGMREWVTAELGINNDFLTVGDGVSEQSTTLPSDDDLPDEIKGILMEDMSDNLTVLEVMFNVFNSDKLNELGVESLQVNVIEKILNIALILTTINRKIIKE